MSAVETAAIVGTVVATGAVALALAGDATTETGHREASCIRAGFEGCTQGHAGEPHASSASPASPPFRLSTDWSTYIFRPSFANVPECGGCDHRVKITVPIHGWFMTQRPTTCLRIPPSMAGRAYTPTAFLDTGAVGDFFYGIPAEVQVTVERGRYTGQGKNSGDACDDANFSDLERTSETTAPFERERVEVGNTTKPTRNWDGTTNTHPYNSQMRYTADIVYDFAADNANAIAITPPKRRPPR